MAFTTVVAMATAGGAAATGVAVFTAMTYVGIAMTVIGAVTKDKQLMKTGGLMSMVGGVGGAMTTGGSLASAGGEAAAGEATGAAAGEAAVSAGAEEASRASIADTATESAGNIFAGAPTADAAASTAMPEAAANGAGLSSSAQATNTSVNATPEILPSGTGTTVNYGVSSPAGAADVGSKFDPLKSVAMDDGTTSGINQVISAGGKTDSNSFFSGVGKVWDGLGPQGKGAAVQMVGGAFSGAAETERHNDLMDYRNRELALRSHGSAVARYNKGGIINSAKA